MPMQVSISGQALVFVVRTQGYSLFSRAGLWTYIAFFGAQARLVLPAASICRGKQCTHCGLKACCGAPHFQQLLMAWSGLPGPG